MKDEDQPVDSQAQVADEQAVASQPVEAAAVAPDAAIAPDAAVADVAADAAPDTAVANDGNSSKAARDDKKSAVSNGSKSAASGEQNEGRVRRKRIEIPIETKLQTGIEAATEALRLLGIEVASIAGKLDSEQVVIQLGEITKPAGGVLEGRAWESLQFILNKAINRHAMRRTRLRIEAAGFTGRRGDRLGKVAQALARKVARLRRPITLGPLQQGDLRQFTTQLQRSGGVGVQTVGGDDGQRIVITPGHGRKRRRR